VKAMATILLLIPYFGAATYIYKFLIKHYGSWNICGWTFNIFHQKITHFDLDNDSEILLESDEGRKVFLELDDDNKSVEVSGRTIITNHLQEEKLLVYQVLLLFKFLPQFINLILTQVTRPI
jgi:hypothetical protein